MRKIFLFAFLLIVILASLFLFTLFFHPQNKSFLSPLPKNLESKEPVLSQKTDEFFYSENLWLPADKVTISTEITKPEVSARQAFVIDLKNDLVLYSKNVHQRQPIASTVKIMTAALALERAKPNEVLTISPQAAAIGDDFMGVTAGEKYTLTELLYGLLLPSGNDAAEAIAEGIAGSRDNFVGLMNEKAKILGLGDTKFANPSGLEDDGEQYSTAYDLAVIAHYAWVNFPLFRQIVATPNIVFPYSADHKYLYLENQTNLLTSYPGVKGIKPGYTPEAGLCLVTLAERDNHQILGVVLGSEDRRGDMEMLLDYSFAVLKTKV